jgi:hypothetical protein
MDAVIVTAAGPAMREVLHDLALPTFHRYAQRWGYHVRAVDLVVDGQGTDLGARQAKWAKLRLLRQALAQYRLALWLDADVLLLRQDEDVAGHLRSGDFQGLVLERVPREQRVNPNTGVWLLRAGRTAVRFLDAVEAAGPQPGPWSDQGAVLAALGWDRGDECYHGARPGRGNAFATRTSWLPIGWNQPYQGHRDQAEACGSNADTYHDRPAVAAPHALHFMGMSAQARRRCMRQVLDALPAAQACPDRPDRLPPALACHPTRPPTAPVPPDPADVSTFGWG